MTLAAIISITVKYRKAILVFVMVSLFVLNVYQCQEKKELKQDNERISDNFMEAQKENYTYMLTKSEFKELLEKANTRTTKHVDSLLKANKINVKNVTEVHNVTNTYKDTSIVNVSIPVLDEIKPLNIGDNCWGFKGTLSKNDLKITDKWANSEIDIIDHSKRKKILGIRIGKKEQNIQAFSDCGKVSVRTFKKE